jgi:hypothetical protein
MISIWRNYMRNKKHFSGLLLGLSLLSSALASAGIDGKSNLVCAVMDVVACTEGPTCLQGSSKTFDLPVFLFVDMKAKVVRGTYDSGNKESSPVSNSETTETQILLQGIEDHRGWSLAIDRQTGHLNLSSSGADVSFMLAGACTAS